MKISDLKERKRELGLSNKMVSDISGVPLSTVEKIFGGTTAAPRYETLRQIENALFGKAGDVLENPEAYPNIDFNDLRMFVNEPAANYAYTTFYGYDDELDFKGKRQGQFTIDDYMKLPAEERMELIDGVLYDMASPSKVHQMIVTQVSARIAAVLDTTEGDCEVFVSPLDVQFGEDDVRNCLQPDLLVVCDRQKYSNENERIMGAPDMVMEVLSPSSRGKDRVLKLNKYAEKGVREYWIVDPEYREIHVYWFDGRFEISRYTFDDQIPLRIFDGRIVVNFSAIHRKLRDRLGL